jgi:hypothetical protein
VLVVLSRMTTPACGGFAGICCPTVQAWLFPVTVPGKTQDALFSYDQSGAEALDGVFTMTHSGTHMAPAPVPTTTPAAPPPSDADTSPFASAVAPPSLAVAASTGLASALDASGALASGEDAASRAEPPASPLAAPVPSSPLPSGDPELAALQPHSPTAIAEATARRRATFTIVHVDERMDSLTGR